MPRPFFLLLFFLLPFFLALLLPLPVCSPIFPVFSPSNPFSGAQGRARLCQPSARGQQGRCQGVAGQARPGRSRHPSARACRGAGPSPGRSLPQDRGAAAHLLAAPRRVPGASQCRDLFEEPHRTRSGSRLRPGQTTQLKFPPPALPLLPLFSFLTPLPRRQIESNRQMRLRQEDLRRERAMQRSPPPRFRRRSRSPLPIRRRYSRSPYSRSPPPRRYSRTSRSPSRSPPPARRSRSPSPMRHRSPAPLVPPPAGTQPQYPM